ncbi:coenzyme F420-0:L-glutamate ligase [Paraburkholderia oxyphila]|uniref:coenzyme F420-0:L-glutamate ligase n=1 Tax=Paraburkholderia oxyphila TaxID=614212 RepID=UPI000488E7D8|nr:coenzyme F420-0:L-glutamate ligase [Paraburkholderia oxyphila]
MNSSSCSLRMFTLPGIPHVKPGDDVGALIVHAMESIGERWQEGDIVVVAQKIVSKAEDRFRRIADITPSSVAYDYAEKTGKDPRKIQAILDESTEVVRVGGVPPNGIIIARHRHGWICANAAIDESNVGEDGTLLLLPEDPDDSARRIAQTIRMHADISPGVIISDTFGRPWRVGLVNVAIGLANVPVIDDWIGRPDAYGRTLQVSQQATADELAAAAGMLMGKASMTPAVVVRGLSWEMDEAARATQYVRPLKEDFFK